MQLPDSTDPAPMNLVMPGQYIGQVLPGSIDPTQNLASDGGSQFGFTIDTGYLSQGFPGLTAQGITVIQFNILTMNVPLMTQAEANERVKDAIGNSSTSNPANLTFNNPIRVSINTNQTITDQTSNVMERAGDTFPSGSNLPVVDLTSWSLTVQTPS